MLEKLEGKYVFFDVDGTLSEYRFNDKLYASLKPELGCQTLEDFLFGDLFLKARPLKTMQRVIEKLDKDKIFVLGTIVSNNEINQKYVWLNENYPNIKKENILKKVKALLNRNVKNGATLNLDSNLVITADGKALVLDADTSKGANLIKTKLK